MPTFFRTPEAERTVSDVESLKVYFDPVRLRLLHEMSRAPRSVHALADATGIPFTRLYYHMHQLEKHGFIRLVETRPGAGAIEEKYYQITAYTFVVDRALMMLGTPVGDAGFDAVQSSVFDATKADIRRSLESGLIDLALFPPEPRSLMARRGVFRLQPDDARAFYDRLNALKMEFYHRESNAEDAEYYNLTVAFYPTALKVSPEDEGDEGETDP